jgi:hypothetical protein
VHFLRLGEGAPDERAHSERSRSAGGPREDAPA